MKILVAMNPSIIPQVSSNMSQLLDAIGNLLESNEIEVLEICGMGVVYECAEYYISNSEVLGAIVLYCSSPSDMKTLGDALSCLHLGAATRQIKILSMLCQDMASGDPNKIERLINSQSSEASLSSWFYRLN